MLSCEGLPRTKKHSSFLSLSVANNEVIFCNEIVTRSASISDQILENVLKKEKEMVRSGIFPE
jgi:hypothetical protein